MKGIMFTFLLSLSHLKDLIQVAIIGIINKERLKRTWKKQVKEEILKADLSTENALCQSSINQIAIGSM